MARPLKPNAKHAFNRRLLAAATQLEAAGHELRASSERWGLTARRRAAVHAWNQAVVGLALARDEVQ